MVLQIGHLTGRSIDISSDGKYIFNNVIGNKIKIWRDDGRLIRIIESDFDVVDQITYSSELNYIACNTQKNDGQYKGIIEIWSLEGNLIQTIEPPLEEYWIYQIHFIPYTRYIAVLINSNNFGNKIYIWDIDGTLYLNKA